MSIELKHISKRFGKKSVIQNFSLNLSTGSRTAIIAPSGTGKTTLFRIIADLDKKFQGEKTVTGKVAFMFQEDRLFEKATVLENVTVVAEDKGENAIRLLDKIGLGNDKFSYPNNLSGGMKRRVALARTLLYNADIVLLDECFTGLDVETKKLVADVINEETVGKTLLIITHDVDEAKLLKCDVMEFKDFITNS